MHMDELHAKHQYIFTIFDQQSFLQTFMMEVVRTVKCMFSYNLLGSFIANGNTLFDQLISPPFLSREDEPLSMLYYFECICDYYGYCNLKMIYN